MTAFQSSALPAPAGQVSRVVRRKGGLGMGNVNRKATGDEMTHAISVIQEAFPEYEVVWGKYHSNVIWVDPAGLSSLTTTWVRKMVNQGTSNKPRSRRR